MENSEEIVSEYPATMAFEGRPWLAVYGATPEDLLSRLSLANPVVLPFWEGWRELTDDYWSDAEGARAYVTPLIDGWTCVISGGLIPMEDSESYSYLTCLCKDLSKEFQKASAFYSDGQGATYLWMVAEDGEIRRKVAFVGELMIDEGEWLPIEQALRTEYEASDYYDEEFEEGDPYAFIRPEAVWRIAGEWAIDLSVIKACDTGLLVQTSYRV